MRSQHINPRYILHADLDAFYASVEQRDNPYLQGKPVVVGGSPETRGVVAAASYEARKFGIHSALPMKTALRLCKHLVRITPRFHRYREISNEIMGYFKDVSPLVEPLSLDEAYIDVTGIENRRQSAIDLKHRIEKFTQLTVTIGGGTSKTVAKVASQVAKPNGLLLILAGQEKTFLKDLQVDLLMGVGPKTLERLNIAGITKIGELASTDMQWIENQFGMRGLELHNKALGLDDAPVNPNRETKSISVETTLVNDLDRLEEIEAVLATLSDRIVNHLHKSEVKGKTVKLKFRLSDFSTFTRQRTLPFCTDETSVIYKTVRQLFLNEYRIGRKFRLFGIGLSGFKDVEQLPLFTGEF